MMMMMHLSPGASCLSHEYLQFSNGHHRHSVIWESSPGDVPDDRSAIVAILLHPLGILFHQACSRHCRRRPVDEFLEVRPRLLRGPRLPHGEHGLHPEGGYGGEGRLGEVPPPPPPPSRASLPPVANGLPCRLHRSLANRDPPQQLDIRFVPRGQPGRQSRHPGLDQFLLVPPRRGRATATRTSNGVRRAPSGNARREDVMHGEPRGRVGNEARAFRHGVHIVVAAIAVGEYRSQAVPYCLVREPSRWDGGWRGKKL
mmetsp:Transcript_821/g.1960  ORF Transcript_821/g.1960 Transcript_821/m.1960 type:complete len:257 (+) Transcript_821:684-1454(+)